MNNILLFVSVFHGAKVIVFNHSVSFVENQRGYIWHNNDNICTPSCAQVNIFHFFSPLSVFPKLVRVDIFGFVQFVNLPEAVWGTCMKLANCSLLPQNLASSLK